MAYRWGELLRRVVRAGGGQQAATVLMRYALLVNEDVRADELQQLLTEQVDPRAGEAAMTEGERLIEQGLVQGREQGLVQGRRELLKRLLEQRFGELSREAAERVDHAGVGELDRWAERVLTATRLDEVWG